MARDTIDGGAEARPEMTTPEHDKTQHAWIKRTAWLVALWAIGVVGVTLVAWLIRVFMNWAGFSA